MLKVVLLALLGVGCAADDVHAPRSDGSGAAASVDEIATDDGAVNPLASAPGCKRLLTADRCCHLACTDPVAFEQQCTTPGACSEWVCQTEGGGSVRFESCNP